MNKKGKSIYKKWDKAIKEKDLKTISNLILEHPKLINQGIIHYRGNGTTFSNLPLHMVNTSLEASKKLIESGADPNKYGDGNVLALHNASIEVTRYLISVGAEVNKIGYEECTPIMYEVYMNNNNNVEYLIERGAHVNYQRTLDGYTSLHFACQKGGVEMISLLLRNGASIDMKNDINQTPVDIVKERNYTEALALFHKSE